MDKLQIGETIFRLRKKKKITQEELGNFMGVSTAAVSKWESGNSYPDITLLPSLAAFFDVSIDELLNYKVELSEDEVMEIFKECDRLFSKGKFDAAVNKCEEYLLKYKSSYYLKFRIGFLFTIYSWKSNSEDTTKKMQVRVMKMYEDVVENCNKAELVEQALVQLSNIYSSQGREDDAIEALNKIHKSEINTNIILASIYIKKGDIKKGRKIFQSELYKDIFFSNVVSMALANSYIENEKNLNFVEKYYKLSIDIKKIFSSEGYSIFSLWEDYLGLAEAYLKFNEKEKAIKMLNKMLNDMVHNDLNKPRKFSSVWCFNEFTEGERAITMNLYENIIKILEEPVFDLVRENENFRKIINKLNALKERGVSLG